MDDVHSSPIPKKEPESVELTVPSEPKKVVVMESELPLCPRKDHEVTGIQYIDYGRVRVIVCDQCHTTIGTVPTDY